MMYVYVAFVCSLFLLFSCSRVTAPRYDFAKSKSQDDRERPWVWDQAYSSLDHTRSSWPGVGR